MPYLENEKKVFRIGKKQWKKRGLVKISEGIEEDTGCGYQAVSPNPTTRFLRIAVAHVLSGNRPRGKWKSKKLAADCVQCAQYKIASQLSRDCYGSFPPSSAVFLAGQLFTPLPTSKRDTLGREQVANMFSYRCGFLRLDTPVFLRLWNRQISFSTMI